VPGLLHSRRQHLANALMAASRVAAQPCVGVRSSWCRKINVHIHGDPIGSAFALKMRPTTAPFASTSKSSSFHWPEGGFPMRVANCMWWFENDQCNSSDAVGRLSLW